MGGQKRWTLIRTDMTDMLYCLEMFRMFWSCLYLLEGNFSSRKIQFFIGTNGSINVDAIQSRYSSIFKWLLDGKLLCHVFSCLSWIFFFAKSASLQGEPTPYNIMWSTSPNHPPKKVAAKLQEERGWKESGGLAPLEWRFPHFQSRSFGQLHLGVWFEIPSFSMSQAQVPFLQHLRVTITAYSKNLCEYMRLHLSTLKHSNSPWNPLHYLKPL